MKPHSNQFDIFNHYNPMNLDHGELLAAYRYDKKTGLFYKRGVKKPLGVFSTDGYVSLPVFKKQYKAHRLAWFYIYGRWPIFVVDHKNGKRYDNRIQNLRDVPQKINAVKRPSIYDSKGPFDPKGKKHYEWLADLVAKEQRIINFS